MIALLHTPGHLPVNKIDLTVYLLQQLRQELAQRLLCHGDADIQQLRAGIEPVQMILQQINLSVGAYGCVIAAVTKEVNPVVKRNRQFRGKADFSIIVRQCFHFFKLLILQGRARFSSQPRAS